MKHISNVLAFALVLAVLAPAIAKAGTSCTTRKSGSVTITSCGDSYRGGGFRECRSYRSGSVIKTSCR
jgi:hypothetical protein